jgi:hypothetical protein
MTIGIYDPEYAMPGELSTTAYDLRTYDQRTDARLDDYQRRIAELEQRLRHVERLLHEYINHADQGANGV